MAGMRLLALVAALLLAACAEVPGPTPDGMMREALTGSPDGGGACETVADCNFFNCVNTSCIDGRCKLAA